MNQKTTTTTTETTEVTPNDARRQQILANIATRKAERVADSRFRILELAVTTYRGMPDIDSKAIVKTAKRFAKFVAGGAQ